MGTHPINLALRLLLELVALGSLGFFGWQLSEGRFRWIAAIGLPLLAAILWGTLAVPDDPSRSGGAPVPVPGPARLALELAIFGCASWALCSTSAVTWGLSLGGLVVLHYALSWDRIAWLMG